MLSCTNGLAYFDHLRRKKVWNDDDDDDGANLKLVRRLMGHLWLEGRFFGSLPFGQTPFVLQLLGRRTDYIFIHVNIMFTCLHHVYTFTSCSHVYMLTCLHAYMLTCLHAYMLTCLHAYMLTCLHAYYTLTCLHAYTLTTRLHAYIFTCLHIYMFKCLHVFIIVFRLLYNSERGHLVT